VSVFTRFAPRLQPVLGYAGLGELELAERTPEAPEVEVEICSVRGAHSSGSTIVAPLNQDVELFFRLRGHADSGTSRAGADDRA